MPVSGQPPSSRPGYRSEDRDRIPTRVGVSAATLFANLFLLVGSTSLGLAAMLTAPLSPRRLVPGRIARLWARTLLLASGVRLHIAGDPPTDGDSYVVMANHSSLMDIPILLVAVPPPVAFLSKRELMRIPLFGWGMWAAGNVPVDRQDRSHAAESFKIASARLQAKISLFVFPEETRSREGRLLPFQRGGFLLAIKNRRRIVPVGIRGSARVRSKGGWVVRPGRVEVHFGRPIEVASRGVRGRRDLVAEVREEIGRLAGVPLEPETES